MNAVVLSLPVIAVVLSALLTAVTIALVALIITHNRRPQGRTEEA